MDYEYSLRLSKNKNVYNPILLNKIGEDVYISGNVEIMRPWLVSIGKHVMIDSGLFCTTQLELGDYIHIGPHCSICGGQDGILRMDHFSGLSAGVRVVCGSDDFSSGTGLRNPTVPDRYRCNMKIAPVIIGPFCTVGANAVLLPGVELAIGSCVGAGAVVTKSTKPWTMYAGLPARAIGIIPHETILHCASKLGYSFKVS